MDIVLTDICKAYGEKTVLEHFSCVIPQGSICAVMAPSGAGKTTLLRLILGLEKCTSGMVNGIPLSKSALFQEDRLFPGMTVLANLRAVLSRKVPEETILSMLDRLGLSECAGQKAAELSGGMARRTALARALLYEGDLLALDEPFNGLDEENRLRAADVIRYFRNGRTTILITHRKDDLELLGVTQVITL